MERYSFDSWILKFEGHPTAIFSVDPPVVPEVSVSENEVAFFRVKRCDSFQVHCKMLLLKLRSNLHNVFYDSFPFPFFLFFPFFLAIFYYSICFCSFLRRIIYHSSSSPSRYMDYHLGRSVCMKYSNKDLLSKEKPKPRLLDQFR